MATLYESPTKVFQSTLDGSLTSSDTTIDLVNASGLVAPGVIVLDRQDGQGNNTASTMEFCIFTGVSTNALTGVTRGVAGSTAQSHNSGSLVEAYLSVTHWGDLVDALQAEHQDDGVQAFNKHVKTFTVTGVSGATGLVGDLVFAPAAGVSLYSISGASGHSYLKFDVAGGTGGLHPFMIVGGIETGTNKTPFMLLEDNTSLKSVSVHAGSLVSTASLLVDINKNLISIFQADTRPMIPGGGTYVSTASINTKGFVSGNLYSLDIDAGGGSNLSIILET